MLAWARQFEQRRWAVENAEGLGRHLSSWLLARGEQVVDVPTTATARVRQLSRGGGRKNDQIDAAAAASVTARCKARVARSNPRASPTPWPCSMSLG